MGRRVALSASGTHAAWTAASAQERFFNSTALAVTVAVMLVYALSGAVFGCLPFFLPDGFVLLQGTPAWLAAAGVTALALAWATHLVHRYGPAALLRACTALRHVAYVLMVTCFCLSLIAAELSHVPPSLRWSGLAPASEWLFAPLPWMWRELLSLASPKVTERLFFFGGTALAFSLLFIKGTKWPRGGLFFIGAAACIAGFYFLGDAAFDYGAARGLPGVSATYAGELKANPGYYNAWNFLSWLGALACLAYGAILIARALLIHDRDAKALAERS
jgi:hypothetical protein